MWEAFWDTLTFAPLFRPRTWPGAPNVLFDDRTVKEYAESGDLQSDALTLVSEAVASARTHVRDLTSQTSKAQLRPDLLAKLLSLGWGDERLKSSAKSRSGAQHYETA